MTDKDRRSKREEKVNCDLHRWKDTCSVMAFSDAPSLSLSCPRASAQTHTCTQSLQRGKPGHNMKDHPPPPMVQWRQSDGWDGEKWERDKTAIWSHAGRSKKGKRGVTDRSEAQTGSGSHIWRVKLAVINPAEWLYLCSVVCLHVVSVVL